ncbi:MAG: FAD-binding protein [Oscillospiraceae bacterium]|nr:FAD-binding protein [Oscillospiraceae bacterium]
MNNFDVIVIGAGPAGIFAALELNKIVPEKKVLILDSGSNISSRNCPARTVGKCVNCKPCNIMNGWAGAGAFSDGKLSLSCEVGGNITNYLSLNKAKELIEYVDKIYLNFGAPEKVYGQNSRYADEIAYEMYRVNIKLIPSPVRHMGTEHSLHVLCNMYEHLKKSPNFKFMEHTTANELLVENRKVTGISVVDKNGEKKMFYAPIVVAAPGRVGSRWLTKIAEKNQIKTINNEVDIGVRVEVPNAVMDHLTEKLYEAKLVYYSDTFENRVRTFCMNPGGIVSEERYNDSISVVNGHSYADKSRKTANTNFAMLVSTRFTSPFNQPLKYGKYIAGLGNMLTGGGVIVQRLGDLLKGRRTDYTRLEKSTTIPTLKTAVAGDLSFVLPHRHLTSIVESLQAYDKVAPGLYSKNTLLYGVEVKFYSSKIDVKDNFETEIENFYTIGDGAGITRGLMQASITGVVVARDISQKYDNLQLQV